MAGGVSAAKEHSSKRGDYGHLWAVDLLNVEEDGNICREAFHGCIYPKKQKIKF